jgi:uncharacterized protein YdeI (BOF family)
MTFTVTGGFTITGGFTVVAPPSPIPTAGWFSTGGALSTVDRMIFATDTAAVSVRGPIDVIKTGAAGFGSNSYGYNTGGYNGPVSIMSSVARITYATDTATASVRGPLTINRWKHGATSDFTTYGWAAAAEGNPAQVSSVDRVTFATDTATATARGPLSAGRYFIGSTGTTSYGWFIGGRYNNPTAVIISTIDRITYASDTATASVRGPLNSVRYTGVGGITDYNTYGWYGGGNPNGPYTSAISRIDYANDTATTAVRGPLTDAWIQGGATGASDTTYGWWGSGFTPSTGGPATSVITRITFATDTNTTTNRTTLSSARFNGATTSGIQ